MARRALKRGSVRDLASGYQIAWLPVVDQTAETTVEALQPILDYFPALIVLKSDNGSAFQSELFEQLLARQEIAHLRSPARTPQYNGSCEAGIGAMKTRTWHFAERQGCVYEWRWDDLNAALEQANHLHRHETDPDRSAADRWAQRTEITPQLRSRFSLLIQRHRAALMEQQTDNSTQTTLLKIERESIAQALVAMGLLSLTRRRLYPPLKHSRLARFP